MVILAAQHALMRRTDPITGRTFYSKQRRRFDDDSAPRELTFSCYSGFRFLAADRTRSWFVEAVQEHRQKRPIDCWAYVLMPEHVHLLVVPREPGVEVGRFAGAVKEQVARQAIAWLEQNAPDWIPKITVREGGKTRRRFWQPGGGYDRNVQTVRALHAMIDYLHANPVRRGLVERPIDWKWSSARWYAGLPDPVLEMDRTLPPLAE